MSSCLFEFYYVWILAWPVLCVDLTGFELDNPASASQVLEVHACDIISGLILFKKLYAYACVMYAASVGNRANGNKCCSPELHYRQCGS